MPADVALTVFCAGEVLVVVGESGASAAGKGDRAGFVPEAEEPPVAWPRSDRMVWPMDDTAPARGFAGSAAELGAGLGAEVELVELTVLVDATRTALFTVPPADGFSTARETAGRAPAAGEEPSSRT